MKINDDLCIKTFELAVLLYKQTLQEVSLQEELLVSYSLESYSSESCFMVNSNTHVMMPHESNDRVKLICTP